MRHPDEEAILRADAMRRQAMIDKDVETLDRLLSGDLLHTHVTGRTENKMVYLARMKDGAPRYGRIERSEETVHLRGDTGWLHGRQKMEIIRQDGTRTLDNRFLSIWVNESGTWKMAAFLTTAIKAE